MSSFNVTDFDKEAFRALTLEEQATAAVRLETQLGEAFRREQQLQSTVTSHVFKSIAEDADRTARRAAVYKTMGAMEGVTADDVIAQSRAFEDRANQAFIQSQFDQETLSGLELDKWRSMASGETLHSQAQGIEERDISAKVEKIKADQMKLQKALDDATKGNTNVANELESTQRDLEEARIAFHEVQANMAKGEATSDDLGQAITKVSTLQNKVRELGHTAITAEKVLAGAGVVVDKGAKAGRALEESLEALLVYDKSNWAINKSINITMGAIKAYTDPWTGLVKDIGKIKDIMATSYDEFARLAVEGGELSKYLLEVNRITEEEVFKSKAILEKQTREISDIIGSGLSEEEQLAKMLTKTSKWMTPTWRLLAARKAEAWGLIDGIEAGIFRNFLFRLKGGLELAINILATVPRFIIYKIIEKTFGSIATEVAIESIATLARLSIAKAASHLAPEVQTIMLLAYAVWDIKNVHNITEWTVDMLSFIGCGLLPVDGLTLDGYDKFSQPGTPGKGEGPEKLWQIDHEELQTGLDFWAKYFIEYNAELHGKPKPVYVPYKPFKGITRRVGKYIDLSVNPHLYDTIGEIEACQALEKSLDLGELVDERGELTGVDAGGQMTSNLFPRIPGTVRNLLNFPLYKNTVAWPNRDGVFVQTEGFFTEDNIDPKTVEAFKYWMNTGFWGPVFTNPTALPADRAAAAETNKADYQRFLRPQKDDPLVWIDVKDWADNNAGKRAIIRQEMHGITLDVLKKEMTTDYPIEPQGEFDVTYNSSDNQSTLDFVESIFKATGRYPYTPSSRRFYNDVIMNKKTTYVEIMTGPAGILQIPTRRASTQAEIHLYSTVVDQIEAYMKALETTQESIEQAWDAVAKDTLWQAYIDNTTPRTEWQYITKLKVLLIVELETNTLIMSGNKKNKLIEEFGKKVYKAGIPLNTNRFHRTSFMAYLNQLVYSDRTTQTIESELEKKTGSKVVFSALLTTVESPSDLWAATIKGIKTIGKDTVDLPVLFGDFHCRVIVVDLERPACFVIFKETKKFWEYAIDADISGAEFSSVKRDATGHYKLKSLTGPEAVLKGIKELYDDSDTFLLHRGFLRVWKAFQSHIDKMMSDIYLRFDIKDVMITGHGAGAAIAQIACLEFPSVPSKKFKPEKPSTSNSGFIPIPGTNPVTLQRPHAYLFASPPVGDTKFAWHFNNLTAESVEVHIDGDVATMMPPFLLPSSTYSGMKGVTTLDDVLGLTDASQLSGGVGLLNRVYQFGNFPQMDLRQFMTDGKVNWGKVGGQAVSLATSLSQHRAMRGAGVFMVLSYLDTSSHVDEFHTDPGNSRGSLDILTHAVLETEAVRARHDLDHIVAKLQKVSEENPDLFEAIDKEEKASWDESSQIHDTNIFQFPPKLPPVPVAGKRPGKVVAIGRTKRPCPPGSVCTLDDLDPDSIVMIPDHEKIRHKEQQRRRAKKKMKKTENDYL